MMLETTTTTEDCQCPHCGELIKDLWDYNWNGNEDIETECGHCDQPITIRRSVTIMYTLIARRSA